MSLNCFTRAEGMERHFEAYQPLHVLNKTEKLVALLMEDFQT